MFGGWRPGIGLTLFCSKTHCLTPSDTKASLFCTQLPAPWMEFDEGWYNRKLRIITFTQYNYTFAGDFCPYNAFFLANCKSVYSSSQLCHCPPPSVRINPARHIQQGNSAQSDGLWSHTQQAKRFDNLITAKNIVDGCTVGPAAFSALYAPYRRARDTDPK